ncbi:MAG: IS1595 family transposase [Candidatus Binataceae bacterium]|nr:IS1595 family transposase [Candidatus Binataceae bacterium]
MDANVPATLHEAVSYFSNPDNCLSTAIALRWPNGVTCPTCGSAEVTLLATRRIWKCKTKHPKQQFSAKAGTIFEDSTIGLDKWFTAIWLISNCKNGISSCEIARDLGVTQKTGWFMMHRIRKAMQQGTFEKFTGEVEADETFIGGLARFMHKDKRGQRIKGTGGAGKAVVMGLLDRHSKKVRLIHLPNVQGETLKKQVRRYVEGGTYLFTDAFVGYHGLDREYIHNVIDHAEAYVQGNVHTNTIENFWSLLKRGLKGTYVSVEPFHLFRYLDEQAFRYNNRKADDADRFTETLISVVGRRLTYKQLTGKTDTVDASI